MVYKKKKKKTVFIYMLVLFQLLRAHRKYNCYLIKDEFSIN